MSRSEVVNQKETLTAAVGAFGRWAKEAKFLGVSAERVAEEWAAIRKQNGDSAKKEDAGGGSPGSGGD